MQNKAVAKQHAFLQHGISVHDIARILVFTRKMIIIVLVNQRVV